MNEPVLLDSEPVEMKNHSVEFKHCTPEGDKMIVDIARVSNPDNRDADPARLIRYLINHNHWSPFQMSSMCLEVTTTRDVGRQILRHLSAIGYQEFSGRYAEYGELLTTRECRFQHPTNRQLSVLPESDEQIMIAREWDEFIATKAAEDEHDYKYWLGKGVAKEVARTILPEGLVPTTMYLHFSIRTWLHYIKERTEEGVQAEHRFIAQQCQALLGEHFPATCLAFFGE
jgi:thymidylate synthase (FAD)